MSGRSAALLVLLGLLGCAFFASAEIALLTIPRVRLRQRVRRGEKRAVALEALLGDLERTISLLLIGSCVTVVAVGAVTTSYCVHRFGTAGVLYALLLDTPLILVLGEILPKALALSRPLGFSLWATPLLRCFGFLLAPILWLVSGSARFLLWAAGSRSRPGRPIITRDELRHLVEHAARGNGLSASQKQIIKRLFVFGETDVREVMVPLVDVVALPADTTPGEAIALIAQHGYSRFPVYEGRSDNIIGFLHTRDLLHVRATEGTIRPHLREVSFVPEQKRVDNLLLEFQEARREAAMVVDEFGSAVGLVTNEDLLEELVGEIQDEHEEPEELLYEKLADDTYIVSGRLEIGTFNEELPEPLPRGNYETVAGLLLDRLQRFPRPSERLSIGRWSFRVLEVDHKRIKVVRCHLLRSAPDPE